MNNYIKDSNLEFYLPNLGMVAIFLCKNAKFVEADSISLLLISLQMLFVLQVFLILGLVALQVLHNISDN